MTAEAKVCRVHSSAYIKRRGRVWRVYSECDVPELLGSGVTKQAAWEAAWKNIPTKEKKSALAWLRIDRMRAELGDAGWEEILGVLDLHISVYVFKKDAEFQILTIDCQDGKAETIREFYERN